MCKLNPAKESRPLTILVNAVKGIGHVNACTGLAQVLKSRGHRIVLVVSKVIQDVLPDYGFEHEFIDDEEECAKLINGHGNYSDKISNPVKKFGMTLLNDGMLECMSSYDKMKQLINSSIFDRMVRRVLNTDSQMKVIMDKYNPDLIIIDHIVGYPSLIYSGKPWVQVFSPNPLMILNDKRTPPGGSGYPSNGDYNSKEWKQFRELRENSFAKQRLTYNKWLLEKGFPLIHNKRCIPESRYLNIYAFPEELDYTDIRPIPDKWLRIDAFFTRQELHKNDELVFKIPETFRNRDQIKEKLIYLSLGSMGAANLPLMKRLIHILSKSPHKLIVSKGVMGDKYELADNMWGENSVPQTNVLPLVDLVITHGGNNTVTETFTFGKPMIVMPLFGDQFDNAQRIQEKGFGLRIDGHKCTEEELLGGIEKLLNDKKMKARLECAAKRIATSNSIVKACERIEKLFEI